MRIINLEVKNFRGIKESSISFPTDTRVVCLIGSGDSTKSTLLQAIEWILWPSWALGVCDNDFYNSDVTAPIVLRGTFSELPIELLAEDKFGFYLRRNDVPLSPGINDEPLDGQPVCLTIQFTVGDTLEPKWEVVCNRKASKPITNADRRLLSAGKVGESASKDMVWGKTSVLKKHMDVKNDLHNVQTAAVREAALRVDLQHFDEIADTIIAVGKQYGVGFISEIKNRLIAQKESFSSVIGLFDGDAPLNQRGMGSQRLLSMGLNIQVSSGNSLLLVDEVENSLEPYRLRSLLNEFRTTHQDSGQVIMTMHSPITVAECTIDELLVIRSNDGKTEAFSLKSEDSETNKAMQAQVRRNAESLLCKRLVVCEGKTEIGFIRALDTFLSITMNCRMAYKGIGTADGDGSSIFKCADMLRSCGYEICLFMDSDLQDEEAEKVQQRAYGVSVFDWDSSNAFEEQIFLDVPFSAVTALLSIAVDEYGLDSVKSRLESSGIPFNVIDDNISLSVDDPVVRKNLGTLAKKKRVEWYKRIDLGEAVGNTVFRSWSEVGTTTKLRKVVEDLIAWVTKND